MISRPTGSRRVVAGCGRFTVLVPMALAVGALCLVGCGDDGPSDEERADVVLALSFLADDFGYTETQVDCVQADLTEIVGDDLATWSTTLRGIDSGEIAIADLDDEEEQVLVGAISRCAVEPS